MEMSGVLLVAEPPEAELEETVPKSRLGIDPDMGPGIVETTMMETLVSSQAIEIIPTKNANITGTIGIRTDKANTREIKRNMLDRERAP